MITLSLGVNAQLGGNKRSGNRQMENSMHGQMMNGSMHEKMMKELNLTDQQKKVIDQSMMSAQKEMKPLQSQLNEAMAHQKTLITADHPDMNAIDQNLDQIGKLRTDIAKIHTRHMVEVRSQLTDEQRVKFDQMQDHMMHDMGTMRPMGKDNNMNNSRVH
jgi:Spy/CpxP family protein refolding chaperone